MAELKRSFLKGRMNKDLDERIIPNGEYRDALNIQVSTSEDSDVGSAQNIKGNVLTTSSAISTQDELNYYFGLPSAWTLFNYTVQGVSSALHSEAKAVTVGTHVDEPTNKIYNFIHKSSELVDNGSYAGSLWGETSNKSYARLTGVRSDSITQFTPSVSDDHKGETIGVVTDVFEVRYSSDVAMPATNRIKGLPYVKVVDSVDGFAGYIVPCVRIGMKVQAIRPDGVDLWAGSDVRVTKVYNVNSSSNSNIGAIATTAAPFTLTSAHYDQGVVYKFSSEKILDFAQGIIEIEQNSELLEPTSTNLITYSSSSSLFGFGGAATRTTDDTILNPEGEYGVARVSNLLGAAGDRLNKNVTITPGRTYTGSIHYKGDGSNIGKTISFYIKRQAGAFSSSDIIRVTLTSEWQRVEMTNTFLADNTLAGIFVYNNSDTATEVLLWGAQIEEQPSATSYIPTGDSPVTRAIGPATSSVNETFITGINVLDGTLYYTDGRTEPKKINIDRLISGTISSILHSSFVNGYSNEFGKEIFDLKKQHICVIKPKPLTPPRVSTFENDRQPTNITLRNPDSGTTYYPNHYYVDSVVSVVREGTFNDGVGVAFRLWDSGINDDSNPEKHRSGLITISAATHRINWRVGDTIELVGQTTGHLAKLKIEMSYSGSGATYGFFNTFRARIVSIDASYGSSAGDPAEIWIGTLVNNNRIYEDSFISFAYRYKYLDNEYSAISPYSKTVFRPGMYEYNSKKGTNDGMENRVGSIILKDFIPSNIPDDVKEVEILLKDNAETNVYSVKSIQRNSNEWLAYSYSTEIQNIISNSGSVNFFANKGELMIDSELYGRTIESNQLIRIFDAVPTTARAQEITANRLMYGNYTEGYDLKDSSGQIINPSITNSSESAIGITSFESTSDSLDVIQVNTPDQDVNVNSATSSFVASSLRSLNPFINAVELVDANERFVNQFGFYTAPTTGYYEVHAYFKAFLNGVGLPTNNDYKSHALQAAIIKVDASGKVDTSAYSSEGYYAGSNFGFPCAASLNPNSTDVLLVGDMVSPLDGTTTGLAIGPVDNNDRLVVVEGEIFLQAGERIAVILPIHPNYIQHLDNSFGILSNQESGVLAYHLSDGQFKVLKAPSETNSITDLVGKESVKSDRSYEIGVVYSDEFGRESTVLVDPSSQVKVHKSKSAFANKLTSKIHHKAPYWASSYKFYAKEKGTEFYNTVMFKAYDNGDNIHAWLAFPSSEKDKIIVGDYIVAKKKHGDNTAIITEKNFFRVLERSDSVPTELSTQESWPDIAPSDENGYFFIKIEANTNFLFYVGGTTNRAGAFANLISDANALSGAVFETRKKKESIDLGLFYEVSQSYPIKLLGNLAEQYIKVGDKVEILPAEGIEDTFNSGTTPIKVVSVKGANSIYGSVEVTVSTSNTNSFGYTDGSLVEVRFVSDDGSYVTGYLNETYSSQEKIIRIKPCTHPNGNYPNLECTISLPFYNCFSFSNGVESDRIRDDFNSDTIYPYTSAGRQVGFKASLESLFDNGFPDYKKEHKESDIIFSQIINQDAGINRISEFLIGDSIVKKLNPEYGSIQKLFTRNSDLIAFCESKVVRILSNKDALFNAEGNLSILTSEKTLGQAIPFAGDYGIAKNPESFAFDEYRCYFVDKNQGAVLRLSMDGITAISDVGMVDWFNDNLEFSRSIIGSFDGKKNEYNITLHSVTNPYVYKNVYTLSYHEPSDGWVSFKSFTPESGVTLNNNYYTFKNSKMWSHHSDSYSPNVYNNFYGQQYTSTITPIFNDAAGSVKSFNTINYEGTQAKVDKFATETVDGVQYTDGEYYNLTEKKGWSVESIVTDQQDGLVSGFKEKEGKWFNKITGVESTFTNAADAGSASGTLDFKEFSVQGIGEVASITGTGGASGHNVTIDLVNTSEIEAVFDKIDLFNQTSLSGSVTANITPRGGYALSASDFTNLSSSSLYNAVTFTDTGTPGTPGNVVEITLTFNNVSVTEALETRLDITGAFQSAPIQYQVLSTKSDQYGSNYTVEGTSSFDEGGSFNVVNTSSNVGFLSALSLQPNITQNIIDYTVHADNLYFFASDIDVSSVIDLSQINLNTIDNYSVDLIVNENSTTSTNIIKSFTLDVSYTPGDTDEIFDDVENVINITANPIKDNTQFSLGTFEVNNEADSHSVSYNTNNELSSAVSSASWLTVDSFDTSNVNFTTSANTGTSRTATITLYSIVNTGLVIFEEQQQITVTQIAAEVPSPTFLNVTPQIIHDYTDDYFTDATTTNISPLGDIIPGDSWSVRRLKIRLANGNSPLVDTITLDDISITGDADMLVNTSLSFHADYPEIPVAYYRFTIGENTTYSTRSVNIAVSHPDDSSVNQTTTYSQLEAFQPVVNTAEITAIEQYSNQSGNPANLISTSTSSTVDLDSETVMVIVKVLSTNGGSTMSVNNNALEHFVTNISAVDGGTLSSYKFNVNDSSSSDSVIFRAFHAFNSTLVADDEVTINMPIDQFVNIFTNGGSTPSGIVRTNIALTPQIRITKYSDSGNVDNGLGTTGPNEIAVFGEDQYPGWINSVSISANPYSSNNSPNSGQFAYSWIANLDPNTTPSNRGFQVGVWPNGANTLVDDPDSTKTVFQPTTYVEPAYLSIHNHTVSGPELPNALELVDLDYGTIDIGGNHLFDGDASITGYSYNLKLYQGAVNNAIVYFETNSDGLPTVSLAEANAGLPTGIYQTTGSESTLANLGTAAEAGGTAFFSTVPSVEVADASLNQYRLKFALNPNETSDGSPYIRMITLHLTHSNNSHVTSLKLIHFANITNPM